MTKAKRTDVHRNTNDKREAAGEITLDALRRVQGLGTAPSARPLTDAELYERHTTGSDLEPDVHAALNMLGPCRCDACERHRAWLETARVSDRLAMGGAGRQVHPDVAAHRERCATVALEAYGLREGERVVLHAPGRHVANGATATIERIDLSFTRGSVRRYHESDYAPENIELHLAIGARPDGTATLRFREPAKHVRATTRTVWVCGNADCGAQRRVEPAHGQPCDCGSASWEPLDLMGPLPIR